MVFCILLFYILYFYFLSYDLYANIYLSQDIIVHQFIKKGNIFITTFYDEKLGLHKYPIRCDKHNLKPYEYYEMCYIKSRLQSVVEEARKETRLNISHMCISLNDAHDRLDAQKKRITKLEEWYTINVQPKGD